MCSTGRFYSVAMLVLVRQFFLSLRGFQFLQLEWCLGYMSYVFARVFIPLFQVIGKLNKRLHRKKIYSGIYWQFRS